MTELFSALLARLTESPWLQGVVAALATFVLEDPTTVGAGLLVADGKMAFVTAFVGVASGIALGDLGLYGAGRLLGPRLAGRGPLTPERLDRAEGWFRLNVVQAVVFSRFVPGMRLPTYFGAGFLRAPFWRFGVTAIMASVVWTLVLLTATVTLGQEIFPLLGRWRWPVATMALVLLVVFQRKVGSRRTGQDLSPPVVSRFEFWPAWLFYIPVVLKWIQLAIRHRGVLLPTAANPSIDGGGFIGESKSKILDLVPSVNRRWVANWITAVGGQEHGGVVKAMQEAGIEYPVVAKPDVGQRGAGVQPVRGQDELQAYIESFPVGVKMIVQEYAGRSTSAVRMEEGLLPPARNFHEAGVMWWRKPGEEQGRISSITLKEFPILRGDGKRTVKQLIDSDARAVHLAAVYQKRHRENLGKILDHDEEYPLVFAGNHCQGAVFRDGTALATPALAARIESIARSIPEFWFGRFDIRFDDFSEFLNGENFKIIEINGASAESTHIWDPSVTLGEAYRVLFEQFRVLFSIGAMNRERGFMPVSLRRFFGDLRAYRKIEKGYPETR